MKLKINGGKLRKGDTSRMKVLDGAQKSLISDMLGKPRFSYI